MLQLNTSIREAGAHVCTTPTGNGAQGLVAADDVLDSLGIPPDLWGFGGRNGACEVPWMWASSSGNWGETRYSALLMGMEPSLPMAPDAVLDIFGLPPCLWGFGGTTVVFSDLTYYKRIKTMSFYHKSWHRDMKLHREIVSHIL